MKGCLFLRNVGFHVSVCKCNLWRNQRMNHDFSNCYLIDVDIQKCLDTHFIYYTNNVLMNLLYVKFLAIQKSFFFLAMIMTGKSRIRLAQMNPLMEY